MDAWKITGECKATGRIIVNRISLHFCKISSYSLQPLLGIASGCVFYKRCPHISIKILSASIRVMPKIIISNDTISIYKIGWYYFSGLFRDMTVIYLFKYYEASNSYFKGLYKYRLLFRYFIDYWTV